ncbi:uncharacterized protein [Penaeus vannamei]|uniref:uncharacterized protein n=1 Tax=Penaeus vannamei TaxID=6689 RepID=UPI00387F6CC3
MGDSDHEPPTSESGIRKFFRGILPHWPRSSPQGGATPTHTDPPDVGNEEATSLSQLKRKSSLLRNHDDSEDSDYEENLPSAKRQRITVSAMRRLFAKFSLSDKEGTDGEVASSSMPGKVPDIPAQKPHPPSYEWDLSPSPPSLISSSPSISNSQSNNNDADIPNMNKIPATSKKHKTSDSSEAKDGKRRKTSDFSDSDDNDDQPKMNNKTRSNGDIVKSNKRQVDLSDSEAEDHNEHLSKVKRTRRLRRGLRLCTNITCYIEQVLYN